MLRQTSVGVHPWSAGRSERNFKDCSKYIPERWLRDERYIADDGASIQPFSIGPRNCLGQVSKPSERTNLYIYC